MNDYTRKAILTIFQIEYKIIHYLKIEHILKLQEQKIYNKFTHNKLTVYLQHSSLDQNCSLRYTLPHTIINAPDVLKCKTYTHNLPGFATYSKKFYLQKCLSLYNITYCYICQ